LFRSVTLFRFFGFPIRADGSWVFLAVLLCWTFMNRTLPGFYPGHSPETYRLMGLACFVGVFASIVAHEVAHAVIAEYYQMPIDNITLFIFGGVAVMKGEPSHPKGEFLMAVAGPVMSALMGLFFWAAEGVYTTYLPPDSASQVLNFLGKLNMIIAAFNMVPAFPLDGGRALRAIIWKLRNNLVLATRIASQAGAVFAYGLLGYACYCITIHNDMLQGMWNGLLGFILHGAGAYAVRQTESRSLLGSEKVSRFMHGNIVSVSPDLLISDLVDNYIYKHFQRVFPVVDRGTLVGVITLQGVLGLDRNKWRWLHVASIMEPLSDRNVVGPEESAATALDVMQRLKKDQLLVAEDRNFLGVIAWRDLAAYLSITMKIDHNRPVATSRTA
jgi:Zn-dependent protease/predicted transcriptional regulator